MNTLSQAQLQTNNLAASPSAPPAPFMYENQVPAPTEATPSETVQADKANASTRRPVAATTPEPGPVPTIQTDSLVTVYEQAGVRAPSHGFTILKVATMVNSAHIRDLSLEGKRAAILMALEINNVQINDIMEDAAKRDLALNQYEARQIKAFQDFKNWKQQQNREIQAEIDLLVEACRSRIEENEKEVANEKGRLDEWRTKKREEERRIQTASAHFQTSRTDRPTSEPVAIAQTEVAIAPSSKVKLLEPRPTASPAVESNGKAPAATAESNGGGKRASLWKR